MTNERSGVVFANLMPREDAIGFCARAPAASEHVASGAVCRPGGDVPPAATESAPYGATYLLAWTDRPTFGTNPCFVKPRDAIFEAGYVNSSNS